jgi:hypothetical protein
VVADGYRGRCIKWALTDFLWAACCSDKATLRVDGHLLGIDGNCDLAAYIGHNGLMDFTISRNTPSRRIGKRKPVIALACKSKQWFHQRLQSAGSCSLLLTNGFMAPEAYTLDAALHAWASGESNSRVKEKAAAAYNKYQRCGLNGARRLFYTD